MSAGSCVYPIIDVISSLLRKWKGTTPPAGGSSRVAILCLLSEAADRSLIAETCRRHGWDVYFADDVEQARRLLAGADFQIVLLDRDVAGEKWRDAMTRLVIPSGAPCTLLISKVFDDYLLNEVVRNGGYDVLAKPLREQDVARAVRLAWSYWMSANRRAAASPQA